MSLEFSVVPPESPHFFERIDILPVPYRCHDFLEQDRLPVRRGDEIVIRYRQSFVIPPPSGFDDYNVQAVVEGGGSSVIVGKYYVHSSGAAALYIPEWPAIAPQCYRLDVRPGINPPVFRLTGVRVIDDRCHTSVIQYQGCGNQLGYNYDLVFPDGTPQYQRLRIYARLETNRVEADTDVFFGSNGLVQKVYSRTRNVFTLKTGWMGVYQANALALAVQHDKFFINDFAYGIRALVAPEQAEIEFPQTPRRLSAAARVSVKMYETGWNKINTYCQTC